jgi:hypothetical protein
MKTLFWGGMLLTGYSLFQLFGYIAAAFPIARGGALLILVLGFIGILVTGYENWCKRYDQGYSYIDQWQMVLGFAPAIALGTIAIIAVVCGVYAAVN